MSKTLTFNKSKHVCRCLALHLLENGPTSFAIDHSLCSGMIVILEKGSILSRCQSPYHHRWQTCHIRVAPHLCSTFHQISTLEKTTCRQCSILSSLMSWRPIRVSPYMFAAHLTSSEVRSDFQIWFSPGFPMQSRQARSDPSRGIVIPNSSSALILLWLFLHLNLLVFFSKPLQDYWWNWNGSCWTNTKDDSIHHVWNFPLLVCLRVGFWIRHTWFGLWGPNWFDRITSPRATLWVLETCLIVGLLPFMIILITALLLSLIYNKASFREEFTFEEIKSTLSRSIFPWIFFRVGCLTVLDHSDAFSREDLWRSDSMNQVRVYRPSLILHPKKWFLILLNCAKLKFVSGTSNWLEQTYGFRKCTMFLQKLISNLQDLPQNRSLETVPVCIVLQYYPHSNTVCNHMYDECKRSNEIIVYPQALVHFVINRCKFVRWL